MNLEKQMLEKFQVEELEKRYEFAWVDKVVVTATVPIENIPVTVKVEIPINTPPPSPPPVPPVPPPPFM
ncbi:hypothetical protein [Flavobacterium sp.]|jgi:hypothetical protein|uniref:hypothetical protein n=1 Tax=Flavobacterium sp. TaxID=239 RepID=UPI0037C08BC3